MNTPTAPKMTDEERERMRASMLESCKEMTCNCCCRDKAQYPVVGVCSSGVVPASFAFCLECLQSGAEPELVLHHLRDDVANGDKDKLIPEIFNLRTFRDGAYITFGEWWDKYPAEKQA